jgi:hypothetical protein
MTGKNPRRAVQTREVRQIVEGSHRLLFDLRDVVSDLRDFANRLGRATRLDFGDTEKLDPAVADDADLNDGVVLNIAPLPRSRLVDGGQRLLGRALEGRARAVVDHPSDSEPSGW